MTSLSSDRAVRRRTILFGGLLAVSLGLMVVSSSGPAVELQRGFAFAFRPIQSGLNSVAGSVAGLVDTVTQIQSLHQTNEQLAQENAQLSAENARAKELERQNELLTQLLEVKGSLGFTTVTGSVVGRESAQFRRVVTLDIGTDRNVQEGDVVVGTGGALLGRVTSVTGNSATVLLINDTSSTVLNLKHATDRRDRSRWRGPLAVPEGHPHRDRRRRPARRERRDPDSIHPADRRSGPDRVRPGHHRLPRRPPAGRSAGDPVRLRGDSAPGRAALRQRQSGAVSARR